MDSSELQEKIEFGWLRFCDIVNRANNRVVGTIILCEQNGRSDIDWLWLAKNLHEIKPKATVTFPFLQNIKVTEPIYLGKSLWTCKCSKDRQFIHTNFTKYCFVCNCGENTKRIPCINWVYDWVYTEDSLEKAKEYLAELSNQVVPGSDSTN